MAILVFDNYDSFTYNLVHCIENITDEKVDVLRNDKISLAEVNAYDKIILSPGPGVPEEAGILLELIKHYGPVKNVLGVCLGHQAIAVSFGGTLRNLSHVFHGVSETINILEEDILFRGLPENIKAGRYHSWVVEEPIPKDFIVTSRDNNGLVMSMKHKYYNLRGVQFHPESILTPLGENIIRNWISFS
ncbi:MAG: aminodeoxychorismate/anthranilate synthase component II [Bacteroidota bacterium]